jgi:hypothetical protein
MKASPIMFFEYLGMLGVPVLLVLLALSALFSIDGIVRAALLILIGAGSLVYGGIAVREVYIHGGNKGEAARR